MTPSMTSRPSESVTENLRISVFAQSDKATGFVACAPHRLGQSRSPDLPPDDNHVFSDSARQQPALRRDRADMRGAVELASKPPQKLAGEAGKACFAGSQVGAGTPPRVPS
jgi:hypothetical protein